MIAPHEHELLQELEIKTDICSVISHFDSEGFFLLIARKNVCISTCASLQK